MKRSLTKILSIFVQMLATFAVTATAIGQQPIVMNQVPSLDLASIDRSADPCTNFYEFACGNYAARNPIPPDQTGANLFHTLYNTNTQELNGILQKYASKKLVRSENEQKIGDYYAACMDDDMIERRDLFAIQPLLSAISRVSKKNIPSLIGELQRHNVDVLFGFGGIRDLNDSSTQVAFVTQGGLGLPQRDYYLQSDERTTRIRKQYVSHVAKMLVLLGENSKQAEVDAASILSFETRLAKGSLSMAGERDARTANRVQTVEQFQQTMGAFAVPAFLKAVHSPPIKSLVNLSPEFFIELRDAIDQVDIAALRAYLRYHLLTNFASDLPERFEEENFDFYIHKLSGQSEQQPRWKRCSSAVDTALGEALGEAWVKQYFTGDSRDQALAIVNDIISAMDRDIDTLDWMSVETKQLAKEKLHAVVKKIGYPEHWRNYSGLRVSATDHLGNALRAASFENDRQLAKIGRPVDKLEWQLSPSTADAFEDPSTNSISIPGGILQPPFFDPKADIAQNYGHIGAIIGHEMTHGFDDQGRKFDADGSLNNWWTPGDAKTFEAKSDCLVQEYSGFSVVGNLKVNGRLTLGENTADNGGLVLAYLAYLERAKREHEDIAKKIDGYSGTQRFFIAYAQNWCENIRPEAIQNRVLSDPHSPNQYRVNGVIINQPAFATAFACRRDAPMAPEKSCRVW